MPANDSRAKRPNQHPNQRTQRRKIDGIILLDKPVDASSNYALQKVKWLLKAEKAGHAGTLDPFATGALPIALGEATKTCTYMLTARKCYRATALLGQQSDTGDLTGQMVAQAAVPELSADEVAAVLQRFLGKQMQRPPRYSALKKDGVPMYKLARDGVEFETQAREIEVHSIRLLSYQDNRVEFETECGKGTYIRSLVEDIGIALGTLAHSVSLHRNWVDPFKSAPLVSLDALEALDFEARLTHLLPLDAGITALPELVLDSAHAKRYLQGQRLPLRKAPGLYRVKYGALALGISESDSEGVLQIQRLLCNPSMANRLGDDLSMLNRHSDLTNQQQGERA
jgi:tRNA pseudouridine55 synthase